MRRELEFPRSLRLFLFSAFLFSAFAPAQSNSAVPNPPAQAAAADRDGQHDFDFELGSWRIHLKRRLKPLTGSNTWVEFDGTSVTRKLWDGRAQIEEFETDGAGGHIEGLTLRTYNPKTRQWSLYWANSKDGTVVVPQIGQFKNGLGEFYAQDMLDGKSIFIRFLWSKTDSGVPHFEQSFSDDGGKTWEVNWITDQTRRRSIGKGAMKLLEQAHPPMVPTDPASPCAVAALEHDPFYRSISVTYTQDDVRRRAALAQYFDYSIQEGRDHGRCVHLSNRAQGVAVWLLPQPPDVQSRAAQDKRAFLEAALGPQGCANYYSIVDFMKSKATNIVDDDAWYLSIIAVDPAVQGQGLGRKLLEPTLTEADRVSATCYLETFTPRNLPFYGRLGFATKARFTEPTTGAEYTLMVRVPKMPGI